MYCKFHSVLLFFFALKSPLSSFLGFTLGKLPSNGYPILMSEGFVLCLKNFLVSDLCWTEFQQNKN